MLYGTFETAVILIARGKHAAIDKGLKAAANARLIDSAGKYLMPGIIDCHSHSMLDAINEGTLSVSSMARTRDVLNPTDVELYRELAGGVTTDRKSTRLNSSHSQISYAVFCFKKNRRSVAIST